jgi:hypothetical protein
MNCEEDGVILMDSLQSLIREPDTSSPNPSTSCKETHDVPESFHVAQQIQKDIGAAVLCGRASYFLTQGYCLCVGKNEVAFEMFRLSTSA